MALKVGELVAFMQLDDKGFASGARGVEQAMQRMATETSSSTSAIERDVVAGFAKVADAIADGVDPTTALAELGKLTGGFQSGMGEMESDARTGGQAVEAALTTSLREMADEAGRAGKQAGDDLVDELRRSLGGAERAAQEAGQEAGRGFGDGTESSGKSRMPDIGNTLISTLKGLGWAAAGAAIGAALMQGLSSAMDAENAKAKLSASVGAFGKDAEKLGRVAGKIYSDAYGESMEEVADAVGTVIQNLDGMNTAGEKSLTGITERAFDVSKIMDEDVSSVVRAVSQLLRTGLAKDADEAFDIIVKGAQNGTNKSEDLLDTFNEYGTKFRDIGLSGQQALGLLSQGLQAGARDSDTVADALKEFAIRARDGSDTSVAAFEAIGLSGKGMTAIFAEGGPKAADALDNVIEKIQGIEDPVERNAVGVALFGTKFEDLGKAFDGLDPSTAVESLGKVGGGAKDAGEALNDTASNKLEAFKRSLEQNVTQFIGDEVLPAMEKLWDSFEAGDLDEKLEELGGKLGETFDGIIEDVQDWADDNQETLGDLKEKYDEVFGGIVDVVTEAVDAVKAIWDRWGEDIMEATTTVLDIVLGFISGGLEMIKGIFKIITGAISGDWEKVWDGIKNVVHGAINGVFNIIDKVMTKLGEEWGFNWDAMKKAVSKKWDEIEAFIKKIPEQLKAIWDNAGTLLKAAGQAILQGLIDGIKAKIDELGDVLGNVTEFIKNNKGPIEKDKVLLVPAGQALMDGLMAGMAQRLPTLERQLDDIGKRIKKKTTEVLGGNEMSGVGVGGKAADGEIARLLGGAKFGLDVRAIAPEVAPDPKPKAKPKPRSDPNDVTYDRGPKPDPNDATYDRNPPKDNGGFVEPSSASGGVTVNMHGTTVREEADIPKIGAEVGFKVLSTV